MIHPRGKKFGVLVYDPTVQQKRWIGTYETLEAAQVAEDEAKWRLGGGRPSVGRGDWRDAVWDEDREACESAVSRGEQLVYFIQADTGGPIKIGVALDPMARLTDLQTASPFRLELCRVTNGGRETEARLHLEYRSLRLWGEWFEPSPSLAFVAGAVSKSGDIGALRRMRDDRDRWRARAHELEDAARSLRAAVDDVLRPLPRKQNEQGGSRP